MVKKDVKVSNLSLISKKSLWFFVYSLYSFKKSKLIVLLNIFCSSCKQSKYVLKVSTKLLIFSFLTGEDVIRLFMLF